jgi:hypothetical protein
MEIKKKPLGENPGRMALGNPKTGPTKKNGAISGGCKTQVQVPKFPVYAVGFFGSLEMVWCFSGNCGSVVDPVVRDRLGGVDGIGWQEGTLEMLGSRVNDGYIVTVVWLW